MSQPQDVFANARAFEATLQGEPQAAPTPAMPSVESPTLESFALPEGHPLVPQWGDALQPGAKAPEKGSLWDAAWHTEGMMQAFRDVFATHGFTPQDDYVPDPDSEEFKQAVGDLPTEYWSDLAGAVSPAHFASLAKVARDHYEAEQTIAAHGGAGVAGRIAVAMVDPFSLALGAASGGVGWLAKGSRVARAVKAGLVASATNTAVEGTLAYASPTRDAHDVAYAALAGFAMGGTFGYIFSGAERAAAVPAVERQASVQAAREAASQGLVPKVRLTPPKFMQRVDDLEKDIDNLLGAQKVDDLAEAGDAPAMAMSQIDREVTLAERKVRDYQTAVDAVDVAQIEARMAAEDAVSGSVVTPKMRRKAAELEAKGARQEAHKRLSDARQGLVKTMKDRERLRKAVAARKRLKRDVAAMTLDEKIAHIADPELRQMYRSRVDTAKAAGAAPATIEEVVAEMPTRSPDVPEVAPHTDSVGAAAAEGTTVDTALRNIPDEGPQVAETAFRKVRFDLAAKLRGGHAAVRQLVGRYVGDSVGAKDGLLTELGASEHAALLHERHLAKFYSSITPTYDEWAKANGHGFFSKWGRPARREFNELVTKAIRNADSVTDPHALKAAAGVRKVFQDVLEEAKAAGVKGFDNVGANANYVPRVYSYQKLAKLMDEIGEEGVVALVRGAMRAKIPATELDDALLDVFSKGYVKRLREVGMGLDTTVTHGVAAKDFDAIAGIIRASGAPEEDIAEIMGRFKALVAKSDTGEGSSRYAKMRFDLDENFSAEIGGKVRRLDDIFENDVEALMGRYARSMSGHIGMAKIGVRSFADHKKNLEGIAAALEGRPDEARKAIDAADLAYKLVTGQPVEKLGDMARWSRFLRDYNFTRTMNQAGFAQIPDLAALFSSAYFRHTLKHFPEFRKMMARGTDGKLKDGFARELEELLGVGTDYHNVAVFSMFDLEADGFAGFLGKAEHGLRVMGRGTQAMSGMAAITASAQRLAAKAIVQRFVSGKWPPKRLAALGIDETMWERIQKGLTDHAELVPGDSGRKVKQLNMGKWTDAEARDTFLAAVHKEARRMVQEEDVGDTHELMHKSLGKLVIQFRRFGIVSYTKQLLNGANHRDAQTATHMMMSFALAGMAYWAQQQVRMAGMDDRKRREWEKKYASPERLAAAAFARSSFSSLIPAVSDSVSSIVLGTKAFDVRTSGQPSDLVGGISSVDAINKFARVLGKSSQSMLRDDRQWTERDLDAFRALLPYGNLIPMQFGYESLVKPALDLPSKQRDRNRDEIDWIFD